MYSMTGYGKATVVKEGRELTVELKSVNHRFLDISTKIPRMFIAYEDVIRSGLSQGLTRGHIDVYVNYVNNGQSDRCVEADVSLANNYVEVARMLADKFGLKDDFQLSALMRAPDVVKTQQRTEDEEILRDMLQEAVAQAVVKLNAMREAEGEKMKADILARIANIKKLVQKVSKLAPTVAENYRAKLTQRIEETLGEVEVDNARLLNEVAFFADKSNIDEEIARLRSHIDNAVKIMSSNEAVGRKMDFLVQEFNREANTVCSKSNDIQLTNVALQLKNEIEKVREQVQNLE